MPSIEMTIIYKRQINLEMNNHMKFTKSIMLSIMLIAFVIGYGCDSMEDNYKQYLKEYNYSGKIDSLRVYPGFERVILAWDNPKDQKSKSIRIVYGVDSTVVNYETLVDSVSIDGLSAGTGYKFIVYTVDAYNNLSVPAYITAFPISQAYVESLTPPMVVVQTIGSSQYVSIMGTSNVVMNFSGNVEYVVSGPNGFLLSDKAYYPNLVGRPQVDIPVSDFISLPFLPTGEYTFEVKVSVWPMQGNLISVDEVWLDNKQTIMIEPIKINLMSIPGRITEKNNDSPGAEAIGNVIDGNPGSKYLTRKATTWIMWHMDNPFIANNYELTAANDAPERDPRDWKLEGSNDGINWTLLDQQSGITFPTRFLKRKFEIANPGEYSHYRIDITANNGSSIFQLADWILYYDSGQK